MKQEQPSCLVILLDFKTSEPNVTVDTAPSSVEDDFLNWDFRSGLEEKVADLLVQLDVDYEYEETSLPFTL